MESSNIIYTGRDVSFIVYGFSDVFMSYRLGFMGSGLGLLLDFNVYSFEFSNYNVKYQGLSFIIHGLAMSLRLWVQF